MANTEIILNGKMVYVPETFKLYPSAKAAAADIGCNYSNLAKCLEGKTKSVKGVHPVYIEDTFSVKEVFREQGRQQRQALLEEKRKREEEERQRREAEERHRNEVVERVDALNAQIAKTEEQLGEQKKQLDEALRELAIIAGIDVVA